MEFVIGDLLESKDKFIVHQTNVVSNGNAVGIAKAIFDKYPYADVYKNRIQRDVPGTIKIMGDGSNNRFIINLFGQFYPGPPKYDNDSELIRQKYFYNGLLAISKIKDIEAIAFNYKIGCGIAGGNWNYYQGVLTNFANFIDLKQGAKVKIYKRPED